MKVHRAGTDGRIIESDVIEAMKSLPDACIDMVFADPPYFLQLENELRRPDDSVVSPVDDEWDHFSSFQSYDEFTRTWLAECRRVMKRDSTIWAIGTYHNIFRIGKLMQDLGFWILNDVVWVKSNPMPNFRGARFTNAHETLIWGKRSKDSGYTFNYWDMKSLNDGLQMRSDWVIPVCSGAERVREDGKRAHSTQKPLALLYRVISSSTVQGATVLDPFLGSGTTAVAARLLGRKWIGIEKDHNYIRIAQERLNSMKLPNDSEEHRLSLFPHPTRRTEERVSFGSLLEAGLLTPGQSLYSSDSKTKVRVNADGSVSLGDVRGSIHQVSAILLSRERANGWDFWFFRENGKLVSIDALRARYRAMSMTTFPPAGQSDRPGGLARETNT